ncbi:serine/threonine protein kinase [Oscillatoria salina]|uniref:serine/threonine protein kinase n=1 Tax=Oscillatoria salina TaxID=331517 RepID=UPI001CC987B1|nr:serine/threonine-protein kinase [Oscillatoria salina]MBZ8180769.1 serine/threonine protein kinase [Oscillatoria salina IIICB1]
METLKKTENIIAGRYRLVAPLGEGAFGTTYEAEDLTNYKRVAIKILSLRAATNWKMLELFEREAKVLANLNHPNIPQYLDYFHIDTPEDRRFYLVQELVAGESLADLVQKGWHANEEEVKNIAKQVLKILKYLHSWTPPVIHRDIKPQNIIRQSDGKIFLVDFGAVQDVYRNTLIKGSTFVGTIGYMAPEQFQGVAFWASDLYGLGATLLFLLTHRNPEELPAKRLKIDFRSRVQISSEFADWLEKMLEPAVEDRFPSAGKALARLSKLQLRQLQIKQPMGSRVVVKETNGDLRLDIPPTGWKTGIIVLPVFGSFLGFPLVFSLAALVSGQFVSAIAILLLTSPLGIIGLLMWAGFFWAIAGKTRLEINLDSFSLQRILFGWKFSTYRGKTLYLQQVEREIDANSKNNQATLALWEGDKKHCFGSTLTKVEQEWIVAKITHFLQRERKQL